MDPLSSGELDRLRDNATERCPGCGIVPRLERDGWHWYHRPGCPWVEQLARLQEE